MLVLGIKKEETIYIGRDIKISVFRSRKGELQIGITAPTQIPISRSREVSKNKLGSEER